MAVPCRNRIGEQKEKVNDLVREGDGMKILTSNNARRMSGLPSHRKTNKRKRFYTRCEALETIRAFLDWCDGKNGPHTLNQEVRESERKSECRGSVGSSGGPTNTDPEPAQTRLYKEDE